MSDCIQRLDPATVAAAATLIRQPSNRDADLDIIMSIEGGMYGLSFHSTTVTSVTTPIHSPKKSQLQGLPGSLFQKGNAMKYTVEYVQGLNYRRLSAKKIVWHEWQKWLELVARHKAGEMGLLSHNRSDCTCCTAEDLLYVSECYIGIGIPCPLDTGGDCCGGLYNIYISSPCTATAQAVADFIESKWKEMK